VSNLKKRLKVVQVGIGKMGKIWLDILRSDSRIQLVGLVDIDNQALEYSRKLCQGDQVKVGENLLDILMETHPDFVLVVTPPFTRKSVICQSLRSGCHVLCEKPLASTFNDLKKIVKMADLSGKLLMVSQNYRYHAGAILVRSLVTEGTIGELISIDVRYADSPNFCDWRTIIDHPLLIDMSIHHLDLIRFLTGLDPIKVFCQETFDKNFYFKGSPTVKMILGLDNSATVNYSGTWASTHINSSLCGEWILTGSKGIIKWNGEYEANLWQQNRLMEKYVVEKEKKDKLELSLEFFIKTLNDFKKHEIPNSYKDNLPTIKTALSACRSAEKQELVII